MKQLMAGWWRSKEIGHVWSASAEWCIFFKKIVFSMSSIAEFEFNIAFVRILWSTFEYIKGDTVKINTTYSIFYFNDGLWMCTLNGDESMKNKVATTFTSEIS